ncbi:hypothetical protein FJY71_05195, partial [candidate division WOR-3 bacterium]|nr:hypothetical protein [candidate division WOR-3 bacterium]
MACFEIRVAAALAVWAAVALAVRPPSSKARAFPPARSPERVPEQEPDGFGAPYRLSSSSADEATGSGPQHTIAADRAGNVHVVWLAADGTIHYREWLRSAGVWLAEDGLSEPRSYVGPPAVACDSAGNVHVVWSAGWSPVELHYRRRDAGSNAWLPEAVITTQGGATPSLACRPNGLDVHVVWSGGDPARIRHVEWTPAGGWSAVGFISSDSTRGTGQASVAVDTAGSVFVTWVQSSAGWPYMSVWLRTRSGGVWVPVEAVSPGVSGWWDQVMADVEATPAGDAHVVWYGASAHAGVFYRAKVGGSWGSIDTVSGGQNYCRPGPGLALAGDTVH